MSRSRRVRGGVVSVFMALCLGVGLQAAQLVHADSDSEPLPFQQDWSDTSLITTQDDWSGVPGIMGYLGDRLGSKTEGVDPQNILVDGTDTSISLIPNQSDPNALGGAGVAEFEISDASIGLSGSNAPHAPFLLISLSTLGRTGITVSYDVRDLESGKQDATQQVALHYRLGNSGSFTNLPEGYVADATEPNAASKVTHVSVTLPAAADHQPLVQLRIMTANAVGKDEWVGIDNIIIDGTPMFDDAPYVVSVTPLDGALDVPPSSSLNVTFSEPVSVAEGWFSLECTLSGVHTFSVESADDVSYTIDPVENFSGGESCTALVYAEYVSDLDLIAPEHPEADYSWSFSTEIFQVFLPLIQR